MVFLTISFLLFFFLASFASFCVMLSRLFFMAVNFHMMTLKLPPFPFSLTFVCVNAFIFLYSIIILSLFHCQEKQRIVIAVVLNYPFSFTSCCFIFLQ